MKKMTPSKSGTLAVSMILASASGPQHIDVPGLWEPGYIDSEVHGRNTSTSGEAKTGLLVLDAAAAAPWTVRGAHRMWQQSGAMWKRHRDDEAGSSPLRTRITCGELKQASRHRHTT